MRSSRGRGRWADWKGVGSYGTIGLEMVLSVLFGMFVGHWLDTKFGTEPYIMVFGFGLGVAAAIRALLRSLREMQRETARDGFKESDTDRPARFALDQQEAEAGHARSESEPPGDSRATESLSPDGPTGPVDEADHEHEPRP